MQKPESAYRSLVHVEPSAREEDGLLVVVHRPLLALEEVAVLLLDESEDSRARLPASDDFGTEQGNA